MAQTWGQIRYSVMQQLPGVNLELITGWIRKAYRAILDERQWVGLDGESTLQTVAQYTTGTATVTAGSSTVTGTDTVWTSAMVGRLFALTADSDYYHVAAFVSATELTLDRAYGGDSATGAAYTIAQDVYELPATVKTVTQMLLPYAARPITRAESLEIQRWDPAKLLISTPSSWAPAADTDETAYATTTRRIRLWPVPDIAYNIPYSYAREASEFTGTNVADYPLPFVHDAAIEQGAIALAMASPLFRSDPGAAQAAQAALTAQQMFLRSMRVADCQARGPARPRFAAWITDHQWTRARE